MVQIVYLSRANLENLPHLPVVRRSNYLSDNSLPQLVSLRQLWVGVAKGFDLIVCGMGLTFLLYDPMGIRAEI